MPVLYLTCVERREIHHRSAAGTRSVFLWLTFHWHVFMRGTRGGGTARSRAAEQPSVLRWTAGPVLDSLMKPQLLIVHVQAERGR